MKYARIKQTQNGFTLVEMAIVLALVGLILGTGLTLLSAQQDQRRVEDTKAKLAEARDALIGFAAANGRLPCPANPTLVDTDALAGIARPATAGGCTADAAGTIQGALPWATLGLPQADIWGHRFTYRVSAAFASNAPFVSLASIGDINIRVATGGVVVAANTPAVIVSHGVNGLRSFLPSGLQMPVSADADETENADNNTDFVSRELSPTFDDQLTWLSQYTLFNRMVQAGRLP